jgi:hypothetical protein
MRKHADISGDIAEMRFVAPVVMVDVRFASNAVNIDAKIVEVTVISSLLA